MMRKVRVKRSSLDEEDDLHYVVWFDEDNSSSILQSKHFNIRDKNKVSVYFDKRLYNGSIVNKGKFNPIPLY